MASREGIDGWCGETSPNIAMGWRSIGVGMGVGVGGRDGRERGTCIDETKNSISFFLYPTPLPRIGAIFGEVSALVQ